ncbi:Iguana/Dzip1-like DAZ-interacting protein N-terminal-domain-containing protein [Phlyctochytrium arcticum]|nr:Iguana/Dzip1-like DAZ-interacting protein N-terminal-domain-containing protein [Phlyctochytrium arcticum]
MYRKQPSQLAPSFFFKRRRERLNWRVLAGIDVSQIQKEIDVQALQDIMENLTYCDIEAEDLAIDPNYIKIFQLAQMVIEYLVHSQDYLIDSRKALAERAQAFMSELEQTRASNNSYKTEMAALRKETRVLKKSLYAFQIMTKLSHPINSVLPTAANNSASYHKCPLCSKLFVTSAYLKAHTQRRHPHTFHPQDTETASTDIAPRKRPEEAAEKMMANMDKVTAKMLETERQLRRDMETRLEKELQYRQNSMDLALQQEKARFQQQLNDMKAELQRSLAEDRSKLDFERDELSRVKAQLQTAESQKSKFGSLEDEESTRSNVKPVPESPSKTQESIDMKAFQDALQNEIKELKMLANKEPGHLSASDREAIKQIATEWRQSDREALEALKI